MHDIEQHIEELNIDNLNNFKKVALNLLYRLKKEVNNYNYINNEDIIWKMFNNIDIPDNVYIDVINIILFETKLTLNQFIKDINVSEFNKGIKENDISGVIKFLRRLKNKSLITNPLPSMFMWSNTISGNNTYYKANCSINKKKYFFELPEA